ncbi:hypothetical protein COOONC_09965 [Cooperia oncophora]
MSIVGCYRDNVYYIINDQELEVQLLSFNTRGRSTYCVLTNMTDKIIEQPAKEMPDMRNVKLKMTNLHLHANGVFSNVYRGTLLSPGEAPREIAIKKTWPGGLPFSFRSTSSTVPSRPQGSGVDNWQGSDAN